MPAPPRPAISRLLEVRPAAPMSWIATMWSLCVSSRQASRRSFSVKGSPTWTAGRFWAAVASKAADARRLAP